MKIPRPGVRLPVGDAARRAVEETLADGYHELHTAPTWRARIVLGAVTLLALVRLFGSAFAVFDEGHPMLSLGRDVQSAWRRLCAAPAFTLFALCTLAVGIGSTTAIYSAVHAFIGPPRGVTDVNALINVTAAGPFSALAFADYEDLKAQQTVFAGLTGWAHVRQSFSGNGQAATAFGEFVDGDYFRLLGVQPQLGRTLQPADDRLNAPLVVVISHGVWQRMFGGTPDVIGRVIKMNGSSFEIVGVAPAGYNGLFNNGLVQSAMWVPLSAVEQAAGAGTGMSRARDGRDRRWVQIRARLAPGRTIDAARAELAGLAAQFDRAYPIGRDLDPRFRLPGTTSRLWAAAWTRDVPIGGTGGSSMIKPIASTFMVAVGLVLLVACTNLANLMLARGARRRPELAVRMALGASRWRLVRAVAVECLLLSVVGGVAGVGLARWLFVLVASDFQVGNGMSLHLDLDLDGSVLMVSAAATLLALVVGGLVPAWQSTRGDLRPVLAGSSSSALPRWRGRRFLIAMQVMVSTLLVSVAALCAAQLRAEGRRDTGMDLDHLAIASVDFASQRYQPAQVEQILGAVLGQLSRSPGVRAVAASSGLPFGVSKPGGWLSRGGQAQVYAGQLASTPSIFETLGVSITRGRALDARDAAGAARVAVISEVTARALFDRVDVVGETLTFTRQASAGEGEPRPQMLTIVGVASATDTSTGGGRWEGTMYVPLAQQPEGRLLFAVRSSGGDPEPLVAALRQAIHGVDPELAIVEAGTGPAVAAPGNVFLQLTAGISGVLGTFALVLALAGLYGVLSFVVQGRSREIGLRIALGADRAQIIGLVIRQGLHPVLTGMAVGLLLGTVARMAVVQPMFARLLPKVDPFVLVVVPLLMALAGALACYVPARRAGGVDPNVALRQA